MLKNFRPFLTGSYAYGVPHEGSDIDLVVFLTERETELLGVQADSGSSNNTEDENYITRGRTYSLRFGNLNLLCTSDEKVFAAWRTITRELKEKRPVSREFAVEYMGKRREELLGDK